MSKHWYLLYSWFTSELLQLNSSNLKYYIEILKVHGIDLEVVSEEQQAKIEKVMKTYEQNLPRATAH